jgi:hypothetical protein
MIETLVPSRFHLRTIRFHPVAIGINSEAVAITGPYRARIHGSSIDSQPGFHSRMPDRCCLWSVCGGWQIRGPHPKPSWTLPPSSVRRGSQPIRKRCVFAQVIDPCESSPETVRVPSRRRFFKRQAVRGSRSSCALNLPPMPLRIRCRGDGVCFDGILPSCRWGMDSAVVVTRCRRQSLGVAVSYPRFIPVGRCSQSK